MSRFGLFCGLGIDYAVPLRSLLKIVPLQKICLLPRLPEQILGVVVVDGQLIPQLDLAKLLSCSAQETSAAYQVVVETECGNLALAAKQSCGIVNQQKGRFESGEGSVQRGVSGEFHFQEKVFQVLDIDSLVIGLIQESW